MQISLRSQMIAGTAAVVGASAIALTPVVAQHEMLPNIQLPSASAAVALAGLNSPISDLISTVNLATNYLFSNADPSVAANWPDALFGTFWGIPPANYPLLPGALLVGAAGGYADVGIVPQIIADHLPIISQLGINGSDYINSSLNGLATAGLDLSEGLWNFPEAVKNAIQSGDLQTALTILTNAIVNPITDAGNVLLQAGSYVFQNVVAKAGAVINTVVGELPQLVNVAVAQAEVLLGKTESIIKTFTTALSSQDFVGAYNAVVDGLLAPSGLPGTLLNLTLGAGVQAGPITAPTQAALQAVFVPSWRTAIQAGVKAIASDLTTTAAVSPVPPPPPVAAKKSVNAPSAAAVSSGSGGSSSGSSKGSSSSSSSRGSSHASNH